MPMHMRWELYPVAHEGERARHGGSYLEESEWWTKPRSRSLWGELKVMVPEILLLVALREHNRRLWVWSFPFHLGLYLVIGCTALMAATGVLGALWPASLAWGAGAFGAVAVPVLGAAGLVLGLVGALGLLHRRRTDPELRDFSAPADYFNLAFFVVAFGVALLSFVVVDRDFTWVTAFVGGLVTLHPAPLPGPGLAAVLPVAAVLLLAGLLAYIPMTHMSHFVGKYFAYHAIRWDDTPNPPGSERERLIETELDAPVRWSAPHVRGDGKRSWAEIATEGPEA